MTNEEDMWDPMQMDGTASPVHWNAGELALDAGHHVSSGGGEGEQLSSDAKNTPVLSSGTIIMTRMLVSDSPEGPWTYQESEMPNTNRHAPGMCNNPAAVEASGSVLLFCKINDHGRQAIFRGASWKGPFHFVKNLHGITGEDLNVWYSKKRGAYHLLYHRYKPHHAATAWSQDGLEWNFQTKPHTAFDHAIKLHDGKVLNVGNRERHHVVVNGDGEPVALYNGVTLGDSAGAVMVHGKSGPSSRYSFTAAVPIRSNKDHKLPSDNSERLKHEMEA